MLKIVKNPSFTHEITVNTPVDGGYKKETLKATYRVLPTDEVDGYKIHTGEGATEFLVAVIERLDGVIGEDDKPLPYNDELRDRLIKIPYIRTALAAGYMDGVNGAAEGN